jgi:hypothetical protein
MLHRADLRLQKLLAALRYSIPRACQLFCGLQHPLSLPAACGVKVIPEPQLCSGRLASRGANAGCLHLDCTISPLSLMSSFRQDMHPHIRENVRRSFLGLVSPRLPPHKILLGSLFIGGRCPLLLCSTRKARGNMLVCTPATILGRLLQVACKQVILLYHIPCSVCRTHLLLQLGKVGFVLSHFAEQLIGERWGQTPCFHLHSFQLQEGCSEE